MTQEHRTIGTGDIHSLANWVVADPAAMAALAVVVGDLYKLCYVASTQKFYSLISASPVTWKLFNTPAVASGSFNPATSILTLTLDDGNTIQISGIAATDKFKDSDFRIVEKDINNNIIRNLAFEVGAISLTTTRTVTAQDFDVVLGALPVFTPNIQYAPGTVIHQGGHLYYTAAGFLSGAAFNVNDWVHIPDVADVIALIPPSFPGSFHNGVAPAVAPISSSTGIAVGDNASANAVNAIVYGDNATADFQDSIALGKSAVTGSTGSVALGKSATIAANSADSVVIGNGAAIAVNSSNSVAIGPLAAVNTTSGFGSVSIGKSATSANGCVAVGINANASGDNGVAIGRGATASGNSGVAIGFSCAASGIYGGAFGWTNTSSGGLSWCSAGAGNTASHWNSQVENGVNAVSRNQSSKKFTVVDGSYVNKSSHNEVHRYVETTDATPTTLLPGAIATINNGAVAFHGNMIATQVAGSAGTVGDSASWTVSGLIKQVGGAYTLVGSTITMQYNDAGAAAWTVAFAAAAGGLQTTVTGGANKQIRWAMSIDFPETW